MATNDTDVTLVNIPEATFGNFRDCINNLVYSTQKYVNELYLDAPSKFARLLKTDSKEERQVLSFFIEESENIIRMKGISFGVEAMQLLIRKRDELDSFFNFCGDIDFFIPRTVVTYLCLKMNDLKLFKVTADVFGNEDKNSLFYFDKYLESKYKDNLLSIDQLIDYEMYSALEAKNLFEHAYNNIKVSFNRLEVVCKESRSPAITAMAIEMYIDILVKMYTCLNSIKLSNHSVLDHFIKENNY